MLIDTIPSQPSQSLNVPYTTRNVVFNYSGGVITFTSCSNQACTWAIDDAARLTVTRPDGTTVTRDFISDTKDKNAENVSDMFRVGNNSVTIGMIDRVLPVRGLPRPLYLVESSTVLPGPSPTVRTLPGSKLSNRQFTTATSRDPVNTYTGSFLYSRSDLSLKGRGPVPQFTRSYDSSDNFAGSMGPGWTHNYAMQLVKPDASTSDIALIGADGRADRFMFNNGSYVAPAGVYMTLAKNADGTYKVSQLNQATWDFDELGRLTRISDRYGNQSVLSYDSNGQLVSVSDPAARGSLNFAYDSGGRIVSVTDWADRVVRYGYDVMGRLSSVTDRENQVTVFNYDDATSRITSIRDARNNIAVTNTYDTQGRVINQKDAKGLVTGQQTLFAYTTNADGTRITTVTYPKSSADPNWGAVEEDHYNAQGRLTKRVTKPTSSSADWITQEYGYDAAGNRSSVKDGRGNTTLYCYDVGYDGTTVNGSRGNLTRTIEPAATSGGNLTVTLRTYDTKNNLTQTVSPKGVASSPTTNCTTNLSAAINTTHATDLAYDTTRTKLASSTSRYTDPGVGVKISVTKYEYGDAANPGMVTKQISPRGNTSTTPDYAYATSNTYYAEGTKAGLLASTTTPAGAKTAFDYDMVGRLISKVEPEGTASGGTPSHHTWQYTYDNEDRLRLTKAPAPTPGQSQLISENRYDAAGNKVVAIDANGQVTKYSYDERDSLHQVMQTPDTWTDPNATPTGLITTEYQYDHNNNLSRIIRAKGNSSQERVTDYKYDGINRQLSETQYPNWPATTPTLVTSYTYDKSGNKASLKDPLGKTTAYTYNNLNRQTNINYSSTVTPNVTYTYDLNGNRASMADGTGTTTYSYDEFNRVTAVQNPGARTVGHRYDLNGNRVKLIYPDNTAVNYIFDSSDRMASLIDWANRTTSYSYNLDSSPKSVSFFNTTVNNYAYDNANRLTQVWNKEGSNTITQHNYTLDAIGNRLRADEVLAAGEWSASPITASRQSNVVYTYDRLSRLTREVRNMQSPQADETIEFTYDAVGNRTVQTLPNPPFSPDIINYNYDKADRLLTSTGDHEEIFLPDANGNITSREKGSITYKLGYDQANRMIRADNENLRYNYDGDGSRSSTQQKGAFSSYPVKDRFIYDTNRDLPALIQDNTNKYVWGLGLLYLVNSSNAPNPYHFDGGGSMVAATDVRGTDQPRIQTYEAYRAYGEQGYSNRTLNQPFKFAGEQTDNNYANAKYQYLRSRYYDPVIGRFTTRDNFAGDPMQPQSLNRYSYVQNNPVNFTDPSGLADYLQVGLGVMRAAAGAREVGVAYTLGTAVAVGSAGTATPLVVAGATVLATHGKYEFAAGTADIINGFKDKSGSAPTMAGVAASAITSDPLANRLANFLDGALSGQFVKSAGQKTPGRVFGYLNDAANWGNAFFSQPGQLVDYSSHNQKNRVLYGGGGAW